MRNASQMTRAALSQSYPGARYRLVESALHWIGALPMLADAVSTNRYAFATRHDSKTFAEQGQ